MNNEKFGIGFILGVGIGAIVGAAIGILTAPKSGAETREDLGEYYGVAKDKAAAYAAIAQEKGAEVIEKGREYLETAQEKGAEVLEKGRDYVAKIKNGKNEESAEEDEEFTIVEE